VETLSLVSRFELIRAHAGQIAVTARGIVERIDVVSDIGDRHSSSLIDLLLDPFLLQASEERLGDGVVPAIAFATHARFEVIRPAESTPRIAAELGALVGMNHRATCATAADRLQHGVEHQFALHGGTRGPTDDLSGEQIHYDR